MGFTVSLFSPFRRLKCFAVDAPLRTHRSIFTFPRNPSPPPPLILLNAHFAAASTTHPQTQNIRHFGTGDLLDLRRRILTYVATLASSISRATNIPQASAGTKRKRMGEPKFYAVQAGHRPGVYTNWADCLNQIRGFKGAKCILFPRSISGSDRVFAS
jgi:hypothetical protein